MTKEEAIIKLKDILEEATETDDSVCYVTSDDADVLKLAIELLKQELCEDCISRQAVKRVLEDRFVEHQKRHDDRKYETIYCLNTILELPLVTPQPKMGRWIRKFHGSPPKPTTVCLKCGFDRDFYIRSRGFDKMKYCPNCGAEMVEPYVPDINVGKMAESEN